MTDLSRLTVSLTKHGAHKVFPLLQHYAPNEVLANTWDKLDGIKINQAQAAKTLSASGSAIVPGIWGQAKARSAETLKQLVMLGIIFSHHALIATFIAGALGRGRGRIRTSARFRGKAFTNIKNDLEELGLATASSADFVDYDFSSLINNPDIADLAAQLFALKLQAAGWTGVPSLVEECSRLRFYDALAITDAEFRAWLVEKSGIVRDEDELPDAADADEEAISPFKFRSGHKAKKIGTSARGASRPVSAQLRHNAIQTTLHEILEARLGKQSVGTEVKTGSPGTSIDLVTTAGAEIDFYEIKTSPSVKKCLRQAIAQLLEYAFWPSKARADRLIVIAEAPVTKNAKAYLQYLRTELRLPLYYAQIDLSAKTLSTLY